MVVKSLTRVFQEGVVWKIHCSLALSMQVLRIVMTFISFDVECGANGVQSKSDGRILNS